MQLYPDTWIDTVLAHPKLARTPWDDECVLATIDSLEAGIVTGTCSRCMEVLNVVTQHSDGYVGEHITTVAGRLYYDASDVLISFLADSGYDSEELFSSLTWSFYYEFPGKKNKKGMEEKRLEILHDIQQKKNAKDWTDAQLQVFEKLERAIKDFQPSW